MAFKWPFKNPVGLTRLHKRLFGRGKKKWTWRRVGRAALYTIGTLILIIIFTAAWYIKDLPTPGKLNGLVSSGSTRLFARNGEPLYTIAKEKKQILIEEKDIPEVMKQATIALEDHNFYNHYGIDARGLARALLFGGERGGGSTITQQLARNTVLNNERTIGRKIKEALIAVEIEAMRTKNEIMTMYLNAVPYGGNNYGIEAAARSFFGKAAKELTLAEAATLASLPQRPTTLYPYGPNNDQLLARRNFALDEMTDLGFITKEAADEAKKVEMKFSPKRESITAPHFVLYVQEWLVNYFTEELGEKQLAEQKVEEGGLNVITTLDLAQQLIAEDVVSKAAAGNLKRAGASNAGLIGLDPKRGEIMAMVGSVDYFQEQFGAFNVTTASRQPGSSFKPVVYAAAFKEKYNPATTLFDLRTDFGGGYEPDNFDGGFRGPITIRQALGNSLNIPAVKILDLVGMDNALQTAKDLGITTLTDKNRYGLSLVLGGGEVKLLEMATAYGVFANNGYLQPTTPILKITDARQKELYNHENPKDGRQVLDPQVAYQITNILADVEAKRPTFSRTMGVLTIPGRPSAVKTGTTNAFRDAWTIGFTPQYVTAVWAGNNDNSSMNNAGGSVAAAPIWAEFMRRVNEKMPVEQFKRPDGIQEITVDRLSNKLPVDGSEPIKDIFARWQVPTEKDDVHNRVRICRENGLLADSSIPDELAEERTFAYVKSEKPNNPRWENPVRAWAAANGLNNRPPTEKCQIGSDTKPAITIESPSSDAVVSGEFSIMASASAPSGIRSVEFYIDNTLVSSDIEAPYQTTYNASQLANGSHTIKVTAISTNGASSSSQISVTVDRDTTPPENVSNFNGTPGPGAGKVTLSWTNPLDPDYRLLRIYVYRDLTQTLITTIEVNSPSISTVISSLQSGVAHRFLARSVDTTGNESAGVTVILTPP